MRKIPHPTYGNYGGAKKKCTTHRCLAPIDWMDKAFMEHDIDLRKAKTKEDRDKADKELGRKLRQGNPKKLKLYGKLYRVASMWVFKWR